MVRTKEFDEEIVVHKAVRAFLKDSYSSTSVTALESATGVGRKSLYNAFGNKEALLLRALDKFAYESAERFILPLEVPGAGRKDIKRVVHAMVAQMTSRYGRDGCLLCLSAQDPIGASKPVAKLIDKYFERARGAFLTCIEVGIREGNITTSTPPRILADYFVGVLMAISTMARSGATRQAIKNYADVALIALG